MACTGIRTAAVLAAGLASALVTPALAEENIFGVEKNPFDGAIISERPTFSTSPQTLPKGRFQVEGGIGVVTDDAVDSVTFPQALVRYGVIDVVEVQVGWSGISVFDRPGDTDVGTGDLVVNAKTLLMEQDGAIPTIGVIAGLSLPVGDDTGSDNVDPSAGVLWSHVLNGGVGVFGNVLVAAPSAGDNRFFQVANSVGVSTSLTDRLGTFVEYFGTYNTEVADTHAIDFGFTYLVNRNFQFDLSGGVGVGGAAPDGFFGGGLAYRW